MPTLRIGIIGAGGAADLKSGGLPREFVESVRKRQTRAQFYADVPGSVASRQRVHS